MIRSVVLYLILVGIPVMGMAAVLQVGQKLQAPVSFAGSWQVEARLDSTCTQNTDQLIIDQSGPALQITTGQGGQLVGQVIGAGFLARGETKLRIEAERRPQHPAEWEGTADGWPCDGARAIPIRGTQLRLPRDLTGH